METQNKSELRAAADDWKNALECFDLAVTDELIDMAAIDVMAAKKRYIYALKGYGEPEKGLRLFDDEVG